MTAAEMFGAYFERSEARTALHETVTHLDEQVRYHNALSACASLLQSSEDESALDLALAAILQATDADYAYIDENYVDPHNGLSSRIVHDSEKPGPRQPTATQEWWDGPYSEWPTSYAALREGRPVQVRVSELAGDERAAYDAEGIKSELLIPIHVNEEWRGSVAFADYVIERRWDSLEIGALRTAARMIGAFWERRDTRRKLERLVGVQERRLRYQRMITAVMSSLTTLRGDAALGESLDHIMSATETDCVALERRVRHPQRGTVCQPVGEVIRAGYEHLVDRPSTCEGAANLPQSVAEAMAQGRPSTNSLTGELRVPILESDRWVGTLVLLSHESNGTWEPEEIAAIQEAAKWISGFWAMSRSVAADPPPAVSSVRPA